MPRKSVRLGDVSDSLIYHVMVWKRCSSRPSLHTISEITLSAAF
jgi:hypothetical protein